jgi:UDP-N-acetylmuramate: L-alanyl-gamma-D-glutamyl-meso-diaminopimelate ligase
MKYHFIAIGGSVMHNLALDIAQQGHEVTGSDDEIFEPSRSRLEKAGILPAQLGWFPEKITSQMDAVILGMHAQKDNPELLKALDIGIPIYSYPEFIYHQSTQKNEL